MGLKILGKAMSFFLKSLEDVTDTTFEVSMGSGETQECFTMMVLYCSDSSETKDMSAARHGADNQHPCVGYHSVFDTMVLGRKSSGPMVTVTMKREKV